MNVYHNGNFYGTGKNEPPLTPIPVRQTFLWEEQEIFLPAIYTGKAGIVLDLCAKIPLGDMAAFLQKWDKKRRLSLKTPEDYEQLEAENPSCRDFLAEMSLDDTPLQPGMGCCLNWYPEQVFRMGNEEAAPAQEEEWDNDANADMLMKAYGCDSNSCWHFARFSYNWKEEPILSPKKLSLTLQQKKIPVTACHFTTDTSCSDENIKVIHPVTGQEYMLTLHRCEQARHSFDAIGAEGILYPEYNRILSYRISPEISRELFDIRDCGEGDRPKTADSPLGHRGEDGPAAVFMAGKNQDPKWRMASSALHFEPVTEIRWRVVFQVQTKADRDVCFSL